MSLETSTGAAGTFLKVRPCRKSHRTLAEQGIGLSIYLLLSLGFNLLNFWVANRSSEGTWYQSLTLPPWGLAEWPESPLWYGYHWVLGISIWVLWRSNSLKTLKLETTLFILALLLDTLSAISLFGFYEMLVSMVFLLLLLCDLLVCALLFWKREPLAGQLLILPFLWIFYVMGINMALCILNP